MKRGCCFAFPTQDHLHDAMPGSGSTASHLHLHDAFAFSAQDQLHDAMPKLRICLWISCGTLCLQPDMCCWAPSLSTWLSICCWAPSLSNPTCAAGPLRSLLGPLPSQPDWPLSSLPDRCCWAPLHPRALSRTRARTCDTRKHTQAHEGWGWEGGPGIRLPTDRRAVEVR